MFSKVLSTVLFVGMLFSMMPGAYAQQTAPEAQQEAQPTTTEEAPQEATKEAAAEEPVEDPAEEPVLPDIIAVVGDEVITGEMFQKDLQYRWKRLSPRERSRISPKQFRNVVLNERIDGIVLISLSSMHEEMVTAEEVQTMVAAFRADFHSEEAFMAFLEKEGMREEELNGIIHTKILRERFIAEETKDIQISEEELRVEYETLKVQGLMQRHMETVDIGYFMIPVHSNLPEEWEHDYARIENLYNRIAAGEDFTAVVRSAYPALFMSTPECIHDELPTSMPPREVQKTLSIMQEGEIAKPFRSLSGWHLLKLFKRNPPGEVPYEKAKKTLHKRLLDARKNAHIKALVDQHKLVMKIEVKQH